jgi:hypothetical protein
MIVARQQLCCTKPLKKPRKSQRVNDSPGRRLQPSILGRCAPRISFPALFRQFNARLCSTPSRGRGENFAIADEFEAFRAPNNNGMPPSGNGLLGYCSRVRSHGFWQDGCGNMDDRNERGTPWSWYIVNNCQTSGMRDWQCSSTFPPSQLDKSEEGRQNAAVVWILPFFKVATTSKA